MAKESTLRQKPVTWLAQYEGIKEGSAGHKEILSVFNDSGLCTRYKMTTSDAWCATAVSAAFIGSDLADIFPCVECSCSQMISLAKSAGIWNESDSYTPAVGDVILYDWQDSGSGDNTGTPDHVGIVSEISGTSFRVIEGNKSNTVGYRSMSVNGKYIRGYILPDYASKATSSGTSSSTTSSTTSGTSSGTSGTLTAATKLSLTKVKLYSASDSTKSTTTVTGTYYLWDGTAKNGRIRITTSKANVGKSGQVTGWISVEDAGGTSTTSTSTSTSTTSATTSKPSYTTGKNYTTQVDCLNVRTGAGTSYSKVAYKDLTSNAQAHANSSGQLRKGTTVTCKGTKTVGDDVWMQIPSGWIAAWYGGEYYVK